MSTTTAAVYTVTMAERSNRTHAVLADHDRTLCGKPATDAVHTDRPLFDRGDACTRCMTWADSRGLVLLGTPAPAEAEPVEVVAEVVAEPAPVEPVAEVEQPAAEAAPAKRSRVSRFDAQVAILNWMGCYEGLSGDTLETLVERGASDADLIDAEEIPADMVAGYRLAVLQHESNVRAAERNRAARA